MIGERRPPKREFKPPPTRPTGRTVVLGEMERGELERAALTIHGFAGRLLDLLLDLAQNNGYAKRKLEDIRNHYYPRMAFLERPWERGIASEIEAKREHERAERMGSRWAGFEDVTVPPPENLVAVDDTRIDEADHKVDQEGDRSTNPMDNHAEEETRGPGSEPPAERTNGKERPAPWRF